MIITSKNRYSTDYRFTIDLTNPTDVFVLDQLKAYVKQVNKNSYVKQRVCLKGRLGKDNLAAPKYKNKFCVSIAKSDAQRFDVYVYDRRA
jgi:hypothetical protein